MQAKKQHKIHAENELFEEKKSKLNQRQNTHFQKRSQIMHEHTCNASRLLINVWVNNEHRTDVTNTAIIANHFIID